MIDSVSGAVHAFLYVGNQAKKSLHIANIVPMKGLLVIYRPHNAIKESIQHI